jgi:predicted ATP-dependent serine protease
VQADRRRGRDAQYDDGSSALVRRRTGQRIDDVPLVERRSEIDAIEDAIERGGRADGRLLIVEGPSGIGKSRLLAAARIIAAQKGAEVLTTCGGELEREFPFGLVRRLLEARAVRAPQAQRESLIRGHAALAGSLLGPSPAPDESPLAG